MIALYIIVGFIVLFALVLSIRAHIHIEYETEITAFAKWAFLKIPLLPIKEKPPKPKKPKKEKEKKEEPPKEEEEKPKEEKPKGPNPLKTLYENEKLEGIINILTTLLSVLQKFGMRVVNSFVIDEMFLDISVSDHDAAATAEKYGKVCRKVFPVTGAVCANCNVKKYSINVEPDYLAEGKSEYAFSLEISLNPRKLINAVLAFAFGALFKVGIRLLKGIKPKTAEKQEKTAPEEQEPAKSEENSDNMINNVNNTESGANI